MVDDRLQTREAMLAGLITPPAPDDRTMRQRGECEWCGVMKKNRLGLCGNCCRFPVRDAAKQERG